MNKFDDLNIKMNVDPNLKNDTILPMGKNNYTYGEIRELFGKTGHSESIRVLVYWDDVCQYTSIGLIELVNSLFKTESNIDLEHFFCRTNEYIYGIQYVKKVYENVLTGEQIDSIKKKFYWKLMEISLKSTVFTSLIKINGLIEKIGFYFPYKFTNCETLRAGFKEVCFPDIVMDNLNFYYRDRDGSFNSILTKKNYNSIITPNISDTYNFIIDNGLKRISIIGPDNHNGLTDELYELLDKYKKLPKPNYCSINYYMEQIVER